ncbi:hypothetical protein BDM02DRAFT_3086770 [Thelephora ganbajun]|uniref:Uncharacterized protein n=1 Tax=Thelephora ganbajun TaxID=370292 RepID=A0ACB6ZWK4_THEGA|nr:hypothetical protein BDM02DRAFT_3086770 [Thelephora ganbajun]
MTTTITTTTTVKRKRTDIPDSVSVTRPVVKKKKANRACIHCQKAHLTCDDSRPCQRCIKRGMPGDCVEGHRKKAKYLLDDNELAFDDPAEPYAAPVSPMFPFTTTTYTSPFDPSSSYSMSPGFSSFGSSFGSEAANLEYSILSAILGSANSPSESDPTASPVPSSASLPHTSSSSEDDLSTINGPSSGVAPHLQCRNKVYENVTKSFDYTEGYHFLMKFLVSRFEKNDILRIVRALAIVRPSLIALQMPLSEEDEVFVEKCFQRSLLELEKLISFSGTPTCVWRRTGEICLVGDEFCLLTEWSKDELLNPRGPSASDDTASSNDEHAAIVGCRKKFIYELFENQSVVEYWENFASHAFESTTQSVVSHCVLLKPNGAPVPCTFCFSIRRDIMDLPSVIIGEYLST